MHSLFLGIPLLSFKYRTDVSLPGPSHPSLHLDEAILPTFRGQTSLTPENLGLPGF